MAIVKIVLCKVGSADDENSLSGYGISDNSRIGPHFFGFPECIFCHFHGLVNGNRQPSCLFSVYGRPLRMYHPDVHTRKRNYVIKQLDAKA